MPKGGKPGGGGGSSGSSVVGTDGDDLLSLPDGASLLTTTVDGRRGNDTLDLSDYESDGVYVAVEYGFAKAKSLVGDQPFTGLFGNYSLAGAQTLSGSLRNIENIIGTAGNDYLFVHTLSGHAKLIDGGPGNDVVNSLGGSATLIGGTGNDWIVSYWENNLLYGGEEGSTPDYSDGARDVFYLGSAPTIADFELLADHLLVEFGPPTTAADVYAPGAAVWMAEGTGSTLYINGVREVTLANVSLADAQGIAFGLVLSPVNNEVSGGPGDDMLYAGGHTTVTRVLVGADSGDDIIINFTLSLDTLEFAAGLDPVWTNSIVNGAAALVATFAGGSLTFQGLSTDDVADMSIQGNRGTIAPDPTPVESAWSVDSDFAGSALLSQADWML